MSQPQVSDAQANASTLGRTISPRAVQSPLGSLKQNGNQESMAKRSSRNSGLTTELCENNRPFLSYLYFFIISRCVYENF